MNRSLGNAWLSFSALGGLICFPAIHGYVFAVVIPIVLFCVAYVNYKELKNKKKFAILAVINLLVGISLYWSPHSSRGGLTGLGMLIAMIVFIPSILSVQKMFKSEAGLETKES